MSEISDISVSLYSVVVLVALSVLPTVVCPQMSTKGGCGDDALDSRQASVVCNRTIVWLFLITKSNDSGLNVHSTYPNPYLISGVPEWSREMKGEGMKQKGWEGKGPREGKAERRKGSRPVARILRVGTNHGSGAGLMASAEREPIIGTWGGGWASSGSMGRVPGQRTKPPTREAESFSALECTFKKRGFSPLLEISLWELKTMKIYWNYYNFVSLLFSQCQDGRSLNTWCTSTTNCVNAANLLGFLNWNCGRKAFNEFYPNHNHRICVEYFVPIFIIFRLMIALMSAPVELENVPINDVLPPRPPATLCHC